MLRQPPKAAQWLEPIEAEDAGALTPERLAALEAAAAAAEERRPNGASRRPAVDEVLSPVAGRRFTRA